jgi:hypothetical protein
VNKIIAASLLLVAASCTPAYAATCAPIEKLPEVHANTMGLGFRPVLNYRSVTSPVPSTVMIMMHPETREVFVVEIFPEGFCVVGMGVEAAPGGPDIPVVPASNADEQAT